MDPELLKLIVPDDYFQTFYKEGVRPDGRAVDKARPVAISHDGQTATVRIGQTMVLARSSSSPVEVLNDDGNLIDGDGCDSNC